MSEQEKPKRHSATQSAWAWLFAKADGMSPQKCARIECLLHEMDTALWELDSQVTALAVATQDVPPAAQPEGAPDDR